MFVSRDRKLSFSKLKTQHRLIKVMGIAHFYDNKLQNSVTMLLVINP
jgi:hypothetical protein